jgi:hypothetical protein
VTVVARRSDLTPELEERIAAHAVDWLGAPGERDWDSYLARLERDEDLELPGQLDDPVIRRVERVARAAWAEANL